MLKHSFSTQGNHLSAIPQPHRIVNATRMIHDMNELHTGNEICQEGSHAQGGPSPNCGNLSHQRKCQQGAMQLCASTPSDSFSLLLYLQFVLDLPAKHLSQAKGPEEYVNDMSNDRHRTKCTKCKSQKASALRIRKSTA